jgi:APA family basic amino acid/polyamine antiporter
MTGLARRLGLLNATMIVMGGIVGSGIFINPYIVARQIHQPALILGAWAIGGWIALSGGFIWAELAARRPQLGGQYAYLREAYHPAVAFIYGWALLLVIQTGGMAAVAVTFAGYFLEVTHVSIDDRFMAVLVLAGLTAINCLGVRAGSTTQNVFMTLKICAIAAIVLCGILFGKAALDANVATP